MCCYFFFFFKQKTAYEMRISDWSSDVCSSDLLEEGMAADDAIVAHHAAIHDGRSDADQAIVADRAAVDRAVMGDRAMGADIGAALAADMQHREKIGRASCRERGCQYV